MIYDERLAAFLHSLDSGNGSFLDDLQAAASREGVPVIRQEMQSFLQVFLELKKPSRILEVGTAVGFSALLMASFTPPDTQIITIENYEKRLEQARKNIASSPWSSRVKLLAEDAAIALKRLPEEQGEEAFDFIFMDAAKAQYIHFLPDVLRLLAPGGILISDNVLQDGVILESHYAVERRDRTIYKRIREYLYALRHTDSLVTSIVPIGDGAAVSVKKTQGGSSGLHA